MPYNMPVNEHGAYEIRLESIGGLGANLSGKILGELGALYMGLNASSFASYGSEKKGSPVVSHIRYAQPQTEILLNSPVESPHLLGLFHENLAGKQPVMAGVAGHTSVVVNTGKPPEQVWELLRMHAGRLFCVDALKLAMEHKTRVNMVMLGALAKAAGFLPMDLLSQAVHDTIGRKYPAALQGNLAGILAGYDAAREWAVPEQKYPYQSYCEIQRDWGYQNAPIGGVNPLVGSTVTNDLSASREGYIPVFKAVSCIHCGLCDTTCPDMVFQFVPGKIKGREAMVNLGPDYHHCKGCLRCTEVCPTDALTVGLEREHDLTKTHVRNQELLVRELEFEQVGTNSWMESESATVNSLY